MTQPVEGNALVPIQQALVPVSTDISDESATIVVGQELAKHNATQNPTFTQQQLVVVGSELVRRAYAAGVSDMYNRASEYNVVVLGQIMENYRSVIEYITNQYNVMNYNIASVVAESYKIASDNYKNALEVQCRQSRAVIDQLQRNNESLQTSLIEANKVIAQMTVSRNERLREERAIEVGRNSEMVNLMKEQNRIGMQIEKYNKSIDTLYRHNNILQDEIITLRVEKYKALDGYKELKSENESLQTKYDEIYALSVTQKGTIQNMEEQLKDAEERLLQKVKREIPDIPGDVTIDYGKRVPIPEPLRMLIYEGDLNEYIESDVAKKYPYIGLQVKTVRGERFIESFTKDGDYFVINVENEYHITKPFEMPKHEIEYLVLFKTIRELKR